MTREPAINLMIALGLLAFPLWAYVADEPFMITLSTRITILALAGIGLNIALGLGGLVSLGHAAFFGIGGYAMGILLPMLFRLFMDNSAAASTGSALASMLIYIVMAVVLILRPTGLYGVRP